MIILMGDSPLCILNVVKALETFGYNKVITYTTHKQREGEINGIDYYFIDKEKFTVLQKLNTFGEVAEYSGWLYGSTISDYKDNSVLVLNPHRLKMFKGNMKKLELHSFYIKDDHKNYEIHNFLISDIENTFDYIIKNNGNKFTSLELASIIYSLDKMLENNKRNVKVTLSK